MTSSSKTSLILFLGPALILIGIFFVIPVGMAFCLSLTDFDIYGLGDLATIRWMGLGTYRAIFKDPLFWQSVKVTLYYVGLGTPLTIFVSLATALLLVHPLAPFKAVFRWSYFLPVTTSLIAVAILWRYLYAPGGFLNYILSEMGVSPINWLGDPHWALPALVIMAVWKNFGYPMIIFIAGLHAIPPHLYEAAELDGASGRQRFWHITLPSLQPTTFFVTITTIIGSLQFFAEPYAMTQGGPLNSTLSVVLNLYYEGFKWWKIGHSSAIAFILFFAVAIIAIIQTRINKRTQE